MTTQTTTRRIVSIVTGPAIKWTDGIYRDSYQGAIVFDGSQYIARVACLCGRDVQRPWDSLEGARAYMDALIDRARLCDPFDADTDH